MEAVRGVDSLKNEINRAKENLKGVDENIKKLTGRDPTESRQPRRASDDVRGQGREGRGRIFNLARRSLGDEDGPPAKKKIIGTAFSRLGPRRGAGEDTDEEDEPPHRPTVQSSVVTPIDTHSREEIIEKQNKNEKEKARNRRMFGSLMGTLRKFKDEAKEKHSKEVLRQQIETKLEEKAIQEKRDMRNQTRQLFEERRKTQEKVKLLEQKMDLVQAHKAWEKEVRKLQNFIRTKSKPHIFYLPKSMDETLESKLMSSRKVIEKMITERKKKLEEEIKELMKDTDDETSISKTLDKDMDTDKIPVDDNKENKKNRNHKHKSRSDKDKSEKQKSDRIHKTNVSFSSEDEDFEDSDSGREGKEESSGNGVSNEGTIENVRMAVQETEASESDKQQDESIENAIVSPPVIDNNMTMYVPPQVIHTDSQLVEDIEKEKNIVRAEDDEGMVDEPADE